MKSCPRLAQKCFGAGIYCRAEANAWQIGMFLLFPRQPFSSPKNKRKTVSGVALAEMEMPDYTLEQKLHYEREILEVCVRGHPLDFLPRNGEAWSDELPKLRGKRVTLCGWLVTYRRVGTKTYR